MKPGPTLPNSFRIRLFWTSFDSPFARNHLTKTGISQTALATVEQLKVTNDKNNNNQHLESNPRLLFIFALRFVLSVFMRSLRPVCTSCETR